MTLVYWDQMKAKQTISKIPRVQVINSLDEFNRPPTMADLVDKDGKAPVPNVPGGKMEKKVPDFLRRKEAHKAAMAAGYKYTTQRPGTTQQVSDDVSNIHRFFCRLRVTICNRLDVIV